jgi:hypothetical protein
VCDVVVFIRIKVVKWFGGSGDWGGEGVHLTFYLFLICSFLGNFLTFQ